jgi:hypothetical protein
MNSGVRETLDSLLDSIKSQVDSPEEDLRMGEDGS